jgi:hypothetical protein
VDSSAVVDFAERWLPRTKSLIAKLLMEISNRPPNSLKPIGFAIAAFLGEQAVYPQRFAD